MPKLLFTARTIESLKPGITQVDYFDTSTKQLNLRITKHGTKTWNLVYRVGKQQRRLKLGRCPEIGLAEARDLAAIAKGDLARKIDPAVARDAAREVGAFGELALDYLEKYSKKEKRTWREDERAINQELLPRWKHTKLTAIRRRDVRRFVEAVAKRAPIQANRYLSLIKSIFNFGVDHDWLEASPCDGLRRVSKENRRDRVLSPDELRTLWTALDLSSKVGASVLKVQLLTGQRIGEVFSARWSDVNMQQRLWTIPAAIAKNGAQHRVPLSDEVMRILRPRKLITASEWVFPAPKDKRKHVAMPTVHKLVLDLRQSPGIEFRTHDLRRTATSQMAEAGVSRFVLARVLNHTDAGVTARYDVYLYDAEKRQALETWATRLRRIIDGKLPAPAELSPASSNG